MKSFIKISTFLFICILFFSCSHSSGSAFEDTSSLKYMAKSIEDKTAWSKEIESEILGTKVEGCDGISNHVDISPSNIFASSTEDDWDFVYPFIPGFTSLNTSMYDQSLKDVVDSFCKGILEDSSVEEYIRHESLYTLVLFYYDFKDSEGNKLQFTNYILGEPFISDSVCQCPVRFFTARTPGSTVFYPDDKYLDINLYLLKEGSSYKINQIELK